MRLEQAEAMFGRARLRAIAPTRQSYANWRADGVPWDVLGPLLLERVSHDATARPQPDGSEGDQPMHVVNEAQGRIFQLARVYGVESKEFRAVTGLLGVYLPNAEELHNGAGAPPHRSARPSPPVPKRRARS